ncbi:uncharacterized protein N7515_001617 [Penicillium bovifimosum]|uniref:Uncharacterized protein n=1 Tax=Penicillium bovifimosum TaxID=126998 RepID=A0A9W9L7A1_9EURO|nr:uncharacterized protein N7515_001617 [Penicillium bovifimosum]KAJ5142830.1 hypothetical protein N7515_001617 [Penicillium bovifimosum]
MPAKQVRVRGMASRALPGPRSPSAQTKPHLVPSTPSIMSASCDTGPIFSDLWRHISKAGVGAPRP